MFKIYNEQLLYHNYVYNDLLINIILNALKDNHFSNRFDRFKLSQMNYISSNSINCHFLCFKKNGLERLRSSV